MTVHLNVIQDGPADGNNTNATLYSPARYDFAWNDDFTAFRPVKLSWWDDASYAAYQARDLDDGYPETDEVPVPACCDAYGRCDDGCPF